MLTKINYRILLIMFPILFCSVLSILEPTSFVSFSTQSLINKVFPCLFATAIATIFPNNNRLWMIVGTLISYLIIVQINNTLNPSFYKVSLIGASLAPICTSIFAPSLNSKHKEHNHYFVNYSLATFFLVCISTGIAFLIPFAYSGIESVINYLYQSFLTYKDISFVYGIIYQFAQTFGIGHFITILHSIDPNSSTSISFFATTLAFNFCVLPAIYLAIAINQERKKKWIWFFCGLVAIISPTSGISISLLLILLLIRYPFLYAYYMLLVIAFYFLGQYIDFEIYVNANNFYEPNINLDEINIGTPKFVLFCTLVFLLTLNSANLVVKQYKKATDYKNNSLIITNAIKINFTAENEITTDYGFMAIQFIKALGGFNNITFCRMNNNAIIFNIIKISAVNIEALYELGITKDLYISDKNMLVLTFKNKVQEIYEFIVKFAEKQFLDITTNYQKIQPYDISKSRFKNKFKIS